MMALKTERRWLEAAQTANEVGDFPTEWSGTPHEKEFGEKQLTELQMRQRYLTAILRIDHWYTTSQDAKADTGYVAKLKEAADTAVEKLKDHKSDVDGDSRDVRAVRGAIRMIILCHEIAGGQCKKLADVRAKLGVGTIEDERRKAVGGAAYYDAACAVSLMLDRLAECDGDEDELISAGLLWLETAVAASLEARRPRVRELAKTDPMLEHLENASPAGFAKALGEEPPAEEPSSDGSLSALTEFAEFAAAVRSAFARN
jgi:hypothetical protein